MKNALCLFGKVGGELGKDGLGDRIDYPICCESYMQHVVKVNNCDVFMHCWDIDIKDELLNLYQPKGAFFEKQIIFSEKDDNRLCSRWYSTKRSVELKRQYEINAKIKYDWVMLGRFDLIFNIDINFDELEHGYFYAAHWNTPPLISKKDKITGKINEPDRINRSADKNKMGFSDLWFIAPSQMMDTFSLLYDYSDVYGVSGHYAPWPFIKDKIGDPEQIVKYKYYRWFDFEIYRFKVCGVYR